MQHDRGGAQRAETKEKPARRSWRGGRSGSRPRLLSMNAARSGNAGAAARLIQVPVSTMGRSMLASAAITTAAAAAIVSRTATATATRAQAARRWPVPGAAPGILASHRYTAWAVASCHGAALGADRDAGIGPPARLAGTGASARPDSQADTHGEQPQAKQERQRVGAEGIMDADDGQDQASGAEDEPAVGSGQGNKAARCSAAAAAATKIADGSQLMTNATPPRSLRTRASCG